MGQALDALVRDDGVELLRRGLVVESIPLLIRDHEREPNEWEHLSNLGVAHRLQGELAKSKDYLKQALRLSPDSPEIWLNFGMLLDDLGDFQDSLEAYRVAFEWMPNNQIAAFDYSTALLRFERWKEAWPLWEFGRHNRTYRLPEGIPIWNGEDLRGKNILVIREGGMGDVFLYMRFFGKLKSQGATVSFLGFPKQNGILEGHPWIDALVNDPVGEYDFCSPLMSLPAFLGSDMSFPCPYIHCNPKARGNSPIVGLSWVAREMGAHKRTRSLSDSDVEPLMDIPIEWVSLDPDRQLDWMDPSATNWVDTAKQIEGLDLVIACDSAVANLAGAMGKEVWILLPRNSEWKWGVGSESKVYPSARLFRQRSESWTDVVGQVSKELR